MKGTASPSVIRAPPFRRRRQLQDVFVRTRACGGLRWPSRIRWWWAWQGA
ncbi:unnamed protein product [[Actinomadura] parvosata subsp. kistnae]|nr:unnamed protein product [Actinomadura parvosata subsp. kistnae]